MKYNILLWGTGERAKKILEKDLLKNCNILGIVDTFKKHDYFFNYKVYLPNEIKTMIDNINYLIIANQYFMDNLELCLELEIDWNKILITNNVQDAFLFPKFSKLKSISEELYYYMKNWPMRLIKINEFDIKDTHKVIGVGKYKDALYMQDYFRYRTFEFIATEIKNNNVIGEVAELGVFRGTFSSLINTIFNEKKLFLFDTFSGFEEQEAAKEVEMGRCDVEFLSSHRDTSVEQMLKNMPYPEMCVVCKGFFPDSISKDAYNIKYSFVSIDVDFEESTYQGLKFFYPRLSEGGAIFVHDYNTFYLDGVKNAIKRFENDINIKLKKVPLADRAGTLVILK